MFKRRKAKKVPRSADGCMNALKNGFLFAVLVLVISTPVYASNENTLRIESITSVSDIIDSHFFSLAKTAKIDAHRVGYFGSWSPDGSRFLIRSTFQPPGTAGLTAIYTMNADGSEIKEIASTLNNTKSKSLDMILGSWSSDGNKIVILTNIFRLRDFFVIADPNGTGFRVVGNNFTTIDSIRENILNIEWQEDFSWSPDGTKAFVIMGFDPRKQQLYTVDEKGFILKQLTNESIEIGVQNPVWSHDGKKIAFNGKNLWIINEDGTGLKQLVQSAENIYVRTDGWSPDNRKLLYMSSEEVNDQFINHLYLINVESADKTEMIKSVEVESPIWNPDGNSIMFKSITERSNPGIYVADSQGKDVKLIYEETSPVEKAIVDAISWSPDGSKIAFASLKNGAKLYTINPDGTGKTLLTSNLSWSWTNPYAWSPSGDKIAFSSSTANGEHVFIANPDGTEHMQITTGENKHYILSGMGGSWSPDGSRLLIESSNEVFIVKLSGYDRSSAIKQGNRTANESIQELPEHSSPEPTLTASGAGKSRGAWVWNSWDGRGSGCMVEIKEVRRK